MKDRVEKVLGIEINDQLTKDVKKLIGQNLSKLNNKAVQSYQSKDLIGKRISVGNNTFLIKQIPSGSLPVIEDKEGNYKAFINRENHMFEGPDQDYPCAFIDENGVVRTFYKKEEVGRIY